MIRKLVIVAVPGSYAAGKEPGLNWMSMVPVWPFSEVVSMLTWIGAAASMAAKSSAARMSFFMSVDTF